MVPDPAPAFPAAVAEATLATVIAGPGIVGSSLLAIQYELGLPRFRSRS